MKTIKYLFVGALMTVLSVPAMAQVSIADAVKEIKSSKDAKATEAVVKQAYKLVKKNAVEVAKLGRAYLDVKDTLNARKYAQLAIKANKNSAAGYLLQGDIEVFNDNPGEAAAWYQNAIYFDSKNAEAYKKYAFIYRGRDPKQAVQTLEQLRTVDPSYPVDAEAGHIYYMSATKNSAYMPLALESYQKVQLPALAKLESYYMTEYALVAFASQKNDLSKKIAEFGLQTKPRNAGYNRLALYNSVELKQYDDAIKYVDRLFNQSDSLEATANDFKFAALAYAGAKNYDEAINYYTKQLNAVEDAEDKAATLKAISDTYKEKGDLVNSLAKYEEYLKVNPSANANDYAGFANIYRNMAAEQTGAEQAASVEKAIAIYDDMKVKYPTSADYSNFMAARTIQLLDADQKKGLAKPYYEALVTSIETAGIKSDADKSRIKEAYTYLGIYLFKIKNDSEAAKPYFDKLISIDPENELAKKVLATY